MFEEFFYGRKIIKKNPCVKRKKKSVNVWTSGQWKKNLQYECRVIFLTSRGKIISDIILKDQIRCTLYFTLRRRKILFFGEVIKLEQNKKDQVLFEVHHKWCLHLIFSSFGFWYISTKRPKYQPSSLFTFFSTLQNQF